MKPVYAENLVVAIKDKGQYAWYVLGRDMCILDYCKLKSAYKQRGYDINIEGVRFGIKVLDCSTKEKFLSNVRDCKISSCELQHMIREEDDREERLSFNPVILIDFDDCRLFSQYPEAESYENFVPEGWSGAYQEFDALLPKEERYWLDENENNLIGGKSHTVCGKSEFKPYMALEGKVSSK